MVSSPRQKFMAERSVEQSCSVCGSQEAKQRDVVEFKQRKNG